MSPALLYLIIAAVLIGTELLIMQFTVFWFLFFGLGALFTSLICFLLPEIGQAQAVAIFFGSSLVTTALLWSPLKKWQKQPSPIAGHDAIGQRAEVLEAISSGKPGKVSWSGSEWPAELDTDGEPLAVGETAIIRKLEGIRLIVGR